MRVLVLGPPALREAVEGHEALEPAPPPIAGLAKSERDAFLLTMDRLHEADALLVDAEHPEAGWAIAWMLARGRLVIIACAKEARPRLPYLIAGNPSPWQRVVVHEGPDDLRRGLRAVFLGRT